MNTYSTCKLAILHEVVKSLRHDKEVATSNRHGRHEKGKGKGKEKGAGTNGSAPGAPSKQAVEKGAGTKGKVGEKLKDEHQIEAAVVAKMAAKKLRTHVKAAVRENKHKPGKRRGMYIWECMHEEDEQAADSADAGTEAAAGANGEGSTDDDLEKAIKLFQDTNLDGHKRRIKWEGEKVEKQVRKRVRWSCIPSY